MLYWITASWRKGDYPLVVANVYDPLCAAVAVLNLLTSREGGNKVVADVVIKEGVTEINISRPEAEQ